MKKLLCLLLALVCVIACVSCNSSDTTDESDTESTVATIADIIGASNPTEIVTKVEYSVNDEDPITSVYETSKDEVNGIYKFVFKSARKAMVEELLPSDVKISEGTVWYNADGTVTSTTGDSWSKEDAVGYLSEMININESSFKSYEIINNGDDLNGTIAATDAKRVFGEDIGAASDITVEIDTNGTYLYAVNIEYTTATGATISIYTSYDYANINLKNAK